MRHFRFQVVMVLGALLFASVHADAQLNETFKITASDAAVLDRFGFSVALSGATAVVGAVTDDDAGIFTGSAYVFNNVPEPTTLSLLALGSLALLRRRRPRRPAPPNSLRTLCSP